MNISAMSVESLLLMILGVTLITFVLALVIWKKQRYMEDKLYALHYKDLHFEEEIEHLSNRLTKQKR